MIAKVEQKLGEGDLKASLADYIRLVQFQRELEQEEAKEITVRWVEPEETEKEANNDAKR